MRHYGGGGPRFLFRTALWNIKDVIEETFQSARYHYQPCTHYKKFAEKIIKTRPLVISFNWDTLLDEALANTGKWFYESGYGVTFNWLYVNNELVLNAGRKSAVLLLKSHGSMNWFRYGNFFSTDRQHFTGEPVLEIERSMLGLYEFERYFQGNSLKRIQPKHCRLDQGIKFGKKLKMSVEPALIPPKTDLNASYITDIWQKAREEITNCRKIVVVGYALKETDQRVYNEIKRAREKNPQKITVRLVAGNEPDSAIEQRAKNIFGQCDIENLGMSFDEYCSCEL
jgi:hypothetical protein